MGGYHAYARAPRAYLGATPRMPTRAICLSTVPPASWQAYSANDTKHLPPGRLQVLGCDNMVNRGVWTGREDMGGSWLCSWPNTGQQQHM